MDRQDGFVFAGMGLGGEQDRPLADRRAQRRELAGSAGRGGASAFRLPVISHVFRAQGVKPRRRLGVDGQAQIVARQERCGAAPRALPALEGSCRHPAVDQPQPHAPRMRAEHHVRPDLGIDEQADGRSANDRESAPPRPACRWARIGAARRPAGARRMTCADVTVPLVTRMRPPGSRSAPRSAAARPGFRRRWRRESRSACPPGRARFVRPMRSAMRARIFLAAQHALAQQQRRERAPARKLAQR